MSKQVVKRFNVFKNGSWPVNGRAIVYNEELHNSLVDLRQLIQDCFHTPTVIKLFTEKGGEITHINQTFHDDVIVFTTQDEDTFQPLVALADHNTRKKSAFEDDFCVNVNWLSSTLQEMDQTVVNLNSSESVLQLKEKIQRCSELSEVNRNELCLIHKGIELEDSQNVHECYLKQKQENSQTAFTVFAVKKPFAIRIVTPTSRRIVVTLETSDAADTTVKQLKQLIYEQERSVEVSKMKLLFNEQPLNDDTTISSSGLFNLAPNDRVLKLKLSMFPSN